MAVIAVGRDDLVALAYRHLHAHHNGLLADIEVAEAADLAHAVELARLFLEAAYEQHQPVGAQLVLRGQLRHAGASACLLGKVVEHGWPFLTKHKLRLIVASTGYLVPL